MTTMSFTPAAMQCVLIFTQLLRRRAERGLTQAEVAERIGVSRVTLARWEGGYREPTMSQLLKWMAALDGRLVPEWM